jgi:polyvinyl alcohol dehydrogenase (cytochrome)
MWLAARNAVLAIACALTGCAGVADWADEGVRSTAESPALKRSTRSGKDWPMAAHDPSGSGHNVKEKKLKRSNVAGLEVKWVFDAADVGAPVAPIHANPVVADGRTYVGSYGGTFYAIGEDGELTWSFATAAPPAELAPFVGPNAPIVAGAVLPEKEDAVVFGDGGGILYKLDRNTGEVVWQTDLDDHGLGGLWGNSVMIVKNTIYVGIASFEPLAPLIPGYVCCSHRGAVAAVDLATGATKWRYEVIAPGDQGPFPQSLIDELGSVEVYGPSGGDVWSQPTYDKASNTLYVSTGQLFSRSPDGDGPETFDAIIALDAETGEEKWVTNLSTNLDVFRFDIPFHDPVTGEYFDKDMADHPKIYTLANGRKVVGAGQKSGEFHVLDADTGEVIASTAHIEMITGEGGFQSGGAMDGETIFLHGSTTPSVDGAPFDGVVMGVNRRGTKTRWELRIPGSALYGSLAVANGVLFFQSPFEEALDAPGNPATWALYAVHTGTGEVLDRITFAGRALNGPAVSRGRVYAGFGGAFAFGPATTTPDGGVVCLGLPGDD